MTGAKERRKGIQSRRRGERIDESAAQIGGAMRILRDESGQAVALTAVCLTMIMGMMALAIDVGYMQYRQIQLQSAADAAAVAAGLELGNCSKVVCTNMKTAAEQALIETGITSATITPTANKCTVSASSGLAMIINVGPCVLGASDPNNGNSNMAEVVLTEPESTFLGSILNIPIFNLHARAEAGEAYYLNSGGGNCIYANSINYNTSANLDLSCGIYDNGNLQTNNSDKATASTFIYYGSWSPNNCQTPTTCVWTLGGGETSPTHTNNQQSDPLAGITAPSKPATQDANNCSLSNQDCWGNNLTTAQQNGTAPITIPPGYYGGGINVNNQNMVLNLSPGLYYFGGTVNMNTNTTLECTTCTGGAGVTLYFASGSMNMNSYSTVELSAPATGNASSGSAVANMLIWEASNNSTTMITNTGSSSYYNGIIYLPDAQLNMNSNSGITNSSATATAIDVQSLLLNTGAEIVINSSGGYLGGGGQTLGQFAIAE